MLQYFNDIGGAHSFFQSELKPRDQHFCCNDVNLPKSQLYIAWSDFRKVPGRPPVGQTLFVTAPPFVLYLLKDYVDGTSYRLLKRKQSQQLEQFCFFNTDFQSQGVWPLYYAILRVDRNQCQAPSTHNDFTSYESVNDMCLYLLLCSQQFSSCILLKKLIVHFSFQNPYENVCFQQTELNKTINFSCYLT